ncbi:hypothetical protein M758_2G192400 [Ceratodon purpureus]|uniref:Secreted protein n=1 Tax=Ceratodon purpureus TaxID=3225 RepID=A0A8T0IYR1_CERPU|nr:hypothetical protein KC19_2G238900 [Ceratodon purpureus]KAG0627332.1 hypothetical protein M758_2G192400 [Ceratodon purpureus]
MGFRALFISLFLNVSCEGGNILLFNVNEEGTSLQTFLSLSVLLLKLHFTSSGGISNTNETFHEILSVIFAGID